MTVIKGGKYKSGKKLLKHSYQGANCTCEKCQARDA